MIPALLSCRKLALARQYGCDWFRSIDQSKQKATNVWVNWYKFLYFQAVENSYEQQTESMSEEFVRASVSCTYIVHIVRAAFRYRAVGKKRTWHWVKRPALPQGFLHGVYYDKDVPSGDPTQSTFCFELESCVNQTCQF